MEKLLNGKANIDIDNKRNTYIDNRLEFQPKTEIESAAFMIADRLKDKHNLRFHLKTVKDIGVPKANEILRLTLEDIEIAKSKGKEIRNPAALFNWKVQRYSKQ